MDLFVNFPPVPSTLLSPLRVAVLAMVLGSSGVAMAQSGPTPAARRRGGSFGFWRNYFRPQLQGALS